MNRSAVVLALLILALSTSAAPAETKDDAAIREAVDRAYVRGVHVDADPELMRGGMHETFIMYVPVEGGVTQLTRDAWIERIATAKARAADAPRPKTTADITILDRTENAAVVRVKLFRDGKQIFTDYISLYQVGAEWKLVGKIFQRH
ncbi:MAG TPA: nuclear transport factor 2 family protein [Thermoanaerobaculia bacterium]|nr:nuclear transport factor 2 family protein [Thermoanaerobaculia bacterium]